MAFRIKFTMDNGTWFKTRNLKNVESFDEAKEFVSNIDGGCVAGILGGYLVYVGAY